MTRFVCLLAALLALGSHAQGQSVQGSLELSGDDASRNHPFDALAVDASRVELVRSLSEAIAAAWEHLGQLEQGEAITRLARARQQAEANADVPGIVSWMAELEAMTAVTAAQIPGASWAQLTDQSLERMASLDGNRVLRPAEAPPQLVTRADAARQRVRAAPLASFEISTNAPEGLLFIDDELVGPLPRRVEIGAGRHLLRVTAPEHTSFGQVIDFDSGERVDMRVRLSRYPHAVRQEAVRNATTLEEARAVLVPGDELWWSEGAPSGRGIIVRCTTEGCSGLTRNEGLQTNHVFTDNEPMLEEEFRVVWMDSQSWLVYTEPPPPEQRRCFQHWGVWAGIGTAVIVGIAASARALRPEPETRFDTTIRFNDL
ncbi:MAG: hypothetical protein AB8H86_09685 [Polyangiales bacterium]